MIFFQGLVVATLTLCNRAVAVPAEGVPGNAQSIIAQLGELVADPRPEKQVLAKKLASEYNPSIDKHATFLGYAMSGNVDVFPTFLTNRNVDPAFSNSAALHSSYGEIIALLLKDGRADPTANGYASLANAIQQNNDYTIQMFVGDSRFHWKGLSDQLKGDLLNVMKKVHNPAALQLLLYKDPTFEVSFNGNQFILDLFSGDSLDAINRAVNLPSFNPDINAEAIQKGFSTFKKAYLAKHSSKKSILILKQIGMKLKMKRTFFK